MFWSSKLLLNLNVFVRIYKLYALPDNIRFELTIQAVRLGTVPPCKFAQVCAIHCLGQERRK